VFSVLPPLSQAKNHASVRHPHPALPRPPDHEQ
jgi:hypothetical protein